MDESKTLKQYLNNTKNTRAVRTQASLNVEMRMLRDEIKKLNKAIELLTKQLSK